MHADPDVQLMLDFQAGDQRAFQDLFEKHQKQVINYCYRFCGHGGVAEELAQETFVRIYKAATRYRPKARFRTWLFKIATNVCLNELRKAVYRQQIDALDHLSEAERGWATFETPGKVQDRPDIQLAEAERGRVVRLAIRELPQKQRAALLLRIEGEFSYREIAIQIGRTENHVKTLIHRGRQSLKRALASYFRE